MGSKTHLLIPDSHAHPDESNRRFEWLGKLILDIKPDVVINIGDMWDMASLSGHSSKKEIEGKRYQADIEAGVDALEKMEHPIRKSKKKRPRRVFTVGNHEDRIPRLVREQPFMEGKVSLADLQLEDKGWEVYPFLTPAFIDGIAYSHYFVSGAMGRAISGENPAKSVINKHHMSCSMGHSHELDYALGTRADGKRIHGLVCGVFQDYKTGWNNQQSEARWWPGVVIKRNVEDGSYDPQFVSVKSLEEEYG